MKNAERFSESTRPSIFDWTFSAFISPTLIKSNYQTSVYVVMVITVVAVAACFIPSPIIGLVALLILPLFCYFVIVTMRTYSERALLDFAIHEELMEINRKLSPSHQPSQQREDYKPPEEPSPQIIKPTSTTSGMKVWRAPD